SREPHRRANLSAVAADSGRNGALRSARARTCRFAAHHGALASAEVRRLVHDVSIVLEHYTDFLAGLGYTLWLSAATLVLGSILGCVFAGLLMSPLTIVKRPTSILVDGLRCIPFLLLVYLIYYGLPQLGIRLDRLAAGLGALVIYHSAYIAEIVRGAWTNLSKDQIEAGRAFGFRGFLLFRRIVLPQLFFASAPLVGNQAIYI